MLNEKLLEIWAEKVHEREGGWEGGERHGRAAGRGGGSPDCLKGITSRAWLGLHMYRSFWNRPKREQNGNPEGRVQVSHGEGCSVGRWELPAEMSYLGSSLDTCRHIHGLPALFSTPAGVPIARGRKGSGSQRAGEENLEERVLG